MDSILFNTDDQSYRNGETIKIVSLHTAYCKLCGEQYTAIVKAHHCGRCMLTKTSKQRDAMPPLKFVKSKRTWMKKLNGHRQMVARPK